MGRLLDVVRMCWIGNRLLLRIVLLLPRISGLLRGVARLLLSVVICGLLDLIVVLRYG